MKKVLCAAVLVLMTVSTGAATSAGVELISLSPRIFPGSARDPFTGLTWNLSISSLDDINNPNYEMRIADQDIPYTHQGNFFLQDPQTFETYNIPFALDAPDLDDSNTNGLGDFFDPSVAVVNAETQGRHPDANGGGVDFTATWNRPAGSTSGTVVLDLPYFGLKFTHDFELVTYSGTFQFTGGSNRLAGSVLLTNLSAADDQFSGPFSISFTNTDSLSYSAGSWTNAAGGSFDFDPVDNLDRAGLSYVSILHANDGYSATADPDYIFWLLAVNSTDANANGVPDMFESAEEPPLPRLEIVKTGSGVQLTVLGPPSSYALEQTADLTSPVWTVLQSVTIIGTSTSVQLPASEPARFYRVRR